MEQKHTPLPYIVSSCEDSDYYLIGKDSGYGYVSNPIFRTHDIHTAAFIVQACNSHYDLIAALEELSDLMNDVIHGTYKPDSFTLQPAREALSKAKGETV